MVVQRVASAFVGNDKARLARLLQKAIAQDAINLYRSTGRAENGVAEMRGDFVGLGTGVREANCLTEETATRGRKGDSQKRCR